MSSSQKLSHDKISRILRSRDPGVCGIARVILALLGSQDRKISHKFFCGGDYVFEPEAIAGNNSQKLAISRSCGLGMYWITREILAFLVEISRFQAGFSVTEVTEPKPSQE